MFRYAVRCLLLVSVVPLLARTSGGADTEPPKDAVTVKVVKYDALGKAIRSHLGKVVVVDFWATTCVPCRQKFPHLVQMSQKLASDGLVAISVSVDEDPQAKETQDKVLKFLESQKAAFPNFILDEPSDVWTVKLGFAGPPCLFVFNRTGQWWKFDGEALGADGKGYEKVDQLVAELLKK